MEKPSLPVSKRRHGEEGGFVIPKKKRTEESAGASAVEHQSTSETSDEITKVETVNQV